MDCREAQEQILESFAAPRPGANPASLASHLAECESCRGFFENQRQLDLQLSLSIISPPLSPGFRRSVMENLRREPYQPPPEFLPDKAHLAGCICATALSTWILPFSAGSIVVPALAFTLATYFIQSVIRGLFETWEEGRQ